MTARLKLLCVHPGPLLYSKVFLRLEPLGLELVAAAARRAGHAVRLIDLQVEPLRPFDRLLSDWRPDVIALACNYLANIPEIVDLAKRAKTLCPDAFVFAGGHSVSFIGGGSPRPRRPARSTASSRARARRRCRFCWTPSLPADAISRTYRGRCSPAARGRRPLRRRPGRSSSRARPAAQPTQVLPRPDGSVRLDRVLPRLPVGLRLLQRLDLLRPQLPHQEPGGCGRGTGAASRARHLHRRRRRLHPRRARACHRRSDRPPRPEESATTSRPAPTCCCATRRCSGSGATSGWSSSSSASRRSTRTASAASASASPWGRTSRRWSSPARSASTSRSTSSPSRLGPRPLPRHPRVVPGDPRDRQHQRQHALSRHRAVAHAGGRA